jgi:ribosomal protein L37AE/L43A
MYAKYKCNVCGKIVLRELGMKLWTPSYCEDTGKDSRLYRISLPVFDKDGKELDG